jgi:hypothetical protein
MASSSSSAKPNNSSVPVPSSPAVAGLTTTELEHKQLLKFFTPNPSRPVVDRERFTALQASMQRLVTSERPVLNVNRK